MKATITAGTTTFRRLPSSPSARLKICDYKGPRLLLIPDQIMAPPSQRSPSERRLKFPEGLSRPSRRHQPLFFPPPSSRAAALNQEVIIPNQAHCAAAIRRGRSRQSGGSGGFSGTNNIPHLSWGCNNPPTPPNRHSPCYRKSPCSQKSLGIVFKDLLY